MVVIIELQADHFAGELAEAILELRLVGQVVVHDNRPLDILCDTPNVDIVAVLLRLGDCGDALIDSLYSVVALEEGRAFCLDEFEDLIPELHICVLRLASGNLHGPVQTVPVAIDTSDAIPSIFEHKSESFVDFPLDELGDALEVSMGQITKMQHQGG